MAVQSSPAIRGNFGHLGVTLDRGRCFATKLKEFGIKNMNISLLDIRNEKNGEKYLNNVLSGALISFIHY